MANPLNPGAAQPEPSAASGGGFLDFLHSVFQRDSAVPAQAPDPAADAQMKAEEAIGRQQSGNPLGGSSGAMAPAGAPPQGEAPATQAAVPALPETQDIGSEGAVKPKGDTEEAVASVSRMKLPHDLESLFSGAREKYGLPEGYLENTARIESGFKRTAHNDSGAAGPFQFVPSTAKQFGLSDPYDWGQATDAAARLAVANQKSLQDGGIESPTASNLYLAHQQGAGGALALLKNPDMPAAEALQTAGLSPQQARLHIASNGGDPAKPAADFVNLWDSKFNGDSGDYSHISDHDEANPAKLADGANPALKAALNLKTPEGKQMYLAMLGMMSGGMQFKPVSYDPSKYANQEQWNDVK